MTPRRIRWFLSLQDVLLTTAAHIAWDLLSLCAISFVLSGLTQPERITPPKDLRNHLHAVWWSYGPWTGERVKTALVRVWTETGDWSSLATCDISSGISQMRWHVGVLPDHHTISSGDANRDKICLYLPTIRHSLLISVKHKLDKMYRRHKLLRITWASASGQMWIWPIDSCPIKFEYIARCILTAYTVKCDDAPSYSSCLSTSHNTRVTLGGDTTITVD